MSNVTLEPTPEILAPFSYSLGFLKSGIWGFGCQDFIGRRSCQQRVEEMGKWDKKWSKLVSGVIVSDDLWPPPLLETQPNLGSRQSIPQNPPGLYLACTAHAAEEY